MNNNYNIHLAVVGHYYKMDFLLKYILNFHILMDFDYNNILELNYIQADIHIFLRGFDNYLYYLLLHILLEIYSFLI